MAKAAAYDPDHRYGPTEGPISVDNHARFVFQGSQLSILVESTSYPNVYPKMHLHLDAYETERLRKILNREKPNEF